MVEHLAPLPRAIAPSQPFRFVSTVAGWLAFNNTDMSVSLPYLQVDSPDAMPTAPESSAGAVGFPGQSTCRRNSPGLEERMDRMDRIFEDTVQANVSPALDAAIAKALGVSELMSEGFR